MPFSPSKPSFGKKKLHNVGNEVLPSFILSTKLGTPACAGSACILCCCAFPRNATWIIVDDTCLTYVGWANIWRLNCCEQRKAFVFRTRMPILMNCYYYYPCGKWHRDTSFSLESAESTSSRRTDAWLQRRSLWTFPAPRSTRMLDCWITW